MDKLGLKQDLDEMWEIVYQGEDFILIHHFDSYQIYNRTIDEFIFIFKEENKKVIEKCKKYINMDHCVYYRKVDEFFLFMLEEDKKIIEKCQQYISLYNKAVEKVRKIEFDFFENHSSEKYPNGKVNRIWKNLEEQWKKIKDRD